MRRASRTALRNHRSFSHRPGPPCAPPRTPGHPRQAPAYSPVRRGGPSVTLAAPLFYAAPNPFPDTGKMVLP